MLVVTRERRRLGLSQNSLARRALLHPTTVSLVESGRFRPGQDQLARLANALGWSGEPAALLEDLETAV